MERDSKRLRNSMIYSVFVRNHTNEGTFRGLEKDLERIRNLGTDIIWLMPIYPIGRVSRKGTLGSPYAIQDYRGINPEYGTMEDFLSLVGKIHKFGMKCILDIVYNHTSPDNVLVKEHPEWFYKKSEGGFGNKTSDWTDVIDLDYKNRELWQYQIDTLKFWAEMVDGFRCDVASLVPVEFWNEARRAVEEVRPGCIWLAETVHPGFIIENREQGFIGHSDCEIYQAFDITYDYDIRSAWERCLKGEITLNTYLSAIGQQESMYPEDYCKLRFLENHDNPRAADMISDKRKLVNWMVFSCLLKGTALIYAGQERMMKHAPGLFDKDVLNWEGDNDLSSLIQKLSRIKRDDLFREGRFSATAQEEAGTILMRYEKKTEGILIIANVGYKAECIITNLPEGIYKDELTDLEIPIRNGEITMTGEPLVIRYHRQSM
ncbi:maltogenic amylase [Kineothrix alysoides]|uniref:Maltogenic amylase n=1 Tax=Kineothrix alysoides TaxID=1469948 RepID=A0A4R1R6R4_9FIRM|nr:alpha-amylase family glycosyl hydrolase [Kineothrix alysoides]TCL61159.1 maltogenic amylase [Kineothrix alysoides]